MPIDSIFFGDAGIKKRRRRWDTSARPAATRASKLSGMRSFKLGQSRRNAGSGRRRAVSSPRLVSHPIRWLRAVRAVSRNIRMPNDADRVSKRSLFLSNYSLSLSLSLSLFFPITYITVYVWPNTNPVSNVGISYVTRVRNALPSPLRAYLSSWPFIFSNCR